MANLKYSALTTQYVKVPIGATVNGSTSYDPSGDVVTMAFTTSPSIPPLTADWKAASWETIGTTHYARCLIGPGGAISLGVNTYTVWVKIADSPEVPVVTASNHLVIY